VESVEVQEIKNSCVCCVKCEPKGFHQLWQKNENSFLWRFEAQLLAYVALGIPMQSYMCLCMSLRHSVNQKSIKISPILTSKSSNPKYIQLPSINGMVSDFLSGWGTRLHVEA
jgi:hypothetical protein